MYKLLDAGVVVNVMLLTQVYEFFELGDSPEKRAFMDHIRYGRALDVNPNSEMGTTNLEILNGVKAGTNADMQTKLDDFLAKCDEEAQVPDKAVITPTVKQVGYKRELIISLNEQIPTTSVTFWGLSDGFKPTNLGCAIHIDEPLKYKATMKGGVFETIEVRVNASNVNFEVI